MKTNFKKHLHEDQLIQAMVDVSALPSEVLEHLATCPGCKEKKRAFEQEMETLGSMAHGFMPSPRRRVRIPETKKPGFGWFSGYHSWRMASAACALLVVLFLGWNVFFKILPERRLAGLEEEIQRDGQFMAEINDLVENPLPAADRAISGEDYARVDDNLLDFIIPQVEESENSPSPA
ncbi:MAG: hypothetical protein WAL98_04125 [Desulfatiglandaceae bacterium]|jgi:hypothetical protein